MRRKKNTLAVDDLVIFKSGNFEGLTGKIIAVDYQSKNPDAIYGYCHTVQLSNGKIGYIEKSEHWDFYQNPELIK